MDVLVEREHRPLRGESLELLDQHVERARLLPLRGQGERRVAIAGRDREQCREEWDRLVEGIGRRREHRVQLLELDLWRIFPGQPGGALEQLDHRVEHTARVMGRAVVAERREALVGQAVAEVSDDARFADAGLAGEQDDVALALSGALPPFQQEVDLLLPADHGPEPEPAQSLEAAFGPALAQDGPRRDGLRKTLEPVRPRVRELEQAADQTPRAPADDDAPGRGERLEAGGEIGRLADHRLLLRRTLADQLADHHQPRGDADPCREGPAFADAELRDRRDQFQPGAHRPLHLVLVRLRIAEVGEHAVAHVLRDMAAPALDGSHHAAMVGADEVAHVLGVEAPAELGRAGEVDEHDRQLAPLACRHGQIARRRLTRRRPWRRIFTPSARGDRLQQALPVAELDPEIGEVGFREVGEDVEIDRRLGEGVGILSEPDPLEPGGQVRHGRLPMIRRESWARRHPISSAAGEPGWVKAQRVAFRFVLPPHALSHSWPSTSTMSPPSSKNLFGTWNIASISPPFGDHAWCRLPAGRQT